ncbi:MAG: hypothetical protein ACTSYI_12850 [Promethearchaeota archaeon]
MADFNSYEITSEFLDRSELPKRNFEQTIPVFGFQEWKNNYSRDEQGSLTLKQNEYDFLDIQIQIFSIL